MEGCFQQYAASRLGAIIASVIDCIRVLISFQSYGCSNKQLGREAACTDTDRPKVLHPMKRGSREHLSLLVFCIRIFNFLMMLSPVLNSLPYVYN